MGVVVCSLTGIVGIQELGINAFKSGRKILTEEGLRDWFGMTMLYASRSERVQSLPDFADRMIWDVVVVVVVMSPYVIKGNIYVYPAFGICWIIGVLCVYCNPDEQ